MLLLAWLQITLALLKESLATAEILVEILLTLPFLKTKQFPAVCALHLFTGSATHLNYQIQ